MKLKSMVHDAGVSIDEIGTYLDGLDHDARIETPTDSEFGDTTRAIGCHAGRRQQQRQEAENTRSPGGSHGPAKGCASESAGANVDSSASSLTGRPVGGVVAISRPLAAGGDSMPSSMRPSR